jgi:hypothetical protein
MPIPFREEEGNTTPIRILASSFLAWSITWPISLPIDASPESPPSIKQPNGYLYGTYSLSIQDLKGGPPVREYRQTRRDLEEAGGREVEVYCRYLHSDLPAAPAPEAK